MEILSVKAQNFASYQNLDFTFTNQGLTLIQGPTGAGKSTLCDLIPWTLFGKTAKGGAVSEVLTWPGNSVTTSTVLMADGYSYTRARGPNAKDNDLYINDGDHTYRGKDLLDTQRLINLELGMDYELYLASSYYHEFSQTAQFFTTTAKNRRVICEQLVDLSLAKTLQTKTSDQVKEKTKEQSILTGKISTLQSNTALLNRLEASEAGKASTWELSHVANKDRVKRSYEQFEAGRKRVISKKCPACSTVLQAPKEVYDKSENPYVAQMASLEVATNPHTGAVKSYATEIEHNMFSIKAYEEFAAALSSDLEELELLQQVIQDFRSVSIENTIRDVEGKTNSLLTKHFDAEIKVQFEIEQADKLEVTIFKDGNQASYTQLSKGQRCLLKLCFGVAVMEAVANHHGIQPQQLFFDEALDGLSEEFKVKAYGLLETLSLTYNSIFVVEHSETLKALFSSSYSVRLNEGSSEICQS